LNETSDWSSDVCSSDLYKCDKCFELIQKCEQEAHDYEFHEIVSTCPILMSFLGSMRVLPGF
jgi:glutaredoxin-related protein